MWRGRPRPRCWRLDRIRGGRGVRPVSFMRKWKWRIALSVGNLLLAIAMSAIGLRQYEKFHATHPGAFYEGNIGYVPGVQLASYCINLIPFVTANALSNFAVTQHLPGVNWLESHSLFYFVYPQYYAALFLFWWLVGWRADTKSASRNTARLRNTLASSLGAMLSLALIGLGSFNAWNDKFIRAIAWSMILWGALLFYYFLVRSWPRRARRTEWT